MDYTKKRKFYFYSILATTLTMFLLITIVFLITSLSMDMRFVINFFVLVILSVGIIMLKRKFDFYDFVTKYQLLVKNSTDPILSKSKINSKQWLKKLKDNEFQIYRDLNNFSIYYKFERIFEKNRKSKAAIIIVSIKNDLPFESTLIVDAINKFEDDFFKKEKFKHHVILQFKNVDEFTEKNVESAQNISFTKPSKNHYVILINTIYSIKDERAYFINSNTHSPNYYYSYAVNQVNNLL